MDYKKLAHIDRLISQTPSIDEADLDRRMADAAEAEASEGRSLAEVDPELHAYLQLNLDAAEIYVALVRLARRELSESRPSQPMPPALMLPDPATLSPSVPLTTSTPTPRLRFSVAVKSSSTDEQLRLPPRIVPELELQILLRPIVDQGVGALYIELFGLSPAGEQRITGSLIRLYRSQGQAAKSELIAEREVDAAGAALFDELELDAYDLSLVLTDGRQLLLEVAADVWEHA